MHKIINFTFLLFVLTLQMNAQQVMKYSNVRFGYFFNYPAYLISAPQPSSGDGIRIYDKKGFIIAASGLNNTLEDTYNSEIQIQLKNIGLMTYGRRGNNWFAIEGIKENKLIYIKEFIGTGCINRLYMECPKDQKDKYVKIIDMVSKSFNPGELTGKH